MFPRVAIVIVMCLLAVGGCSFMPAHRAGPLSPVPLNGALFPDVERAVALHGLEERAVAECMRRRGQRYEPVRARISQENPYGLLSKIDAAADGYGLTSTALARPVVDPNEGWVARLPKRERTMWHSALLGSGHHYATARASGTVSLRIALDGCVHLSRVALYGDGWEQTQLTVEGLTTRVVMIVMASDTFTAAQTRWATCMQARGHDVDTIQQARGRVQAAVSRAGVGRAALRKVGRRELRLASLDAECQQTSRLAEAARTAQHRAESALPDRSRRVVADLMNRQDRALHRSP
jgi:hypothetical protein